MRAISTKISGSSTSEGWKKAKQRRSAGSRRRRRSSQPWISCTASYWMIFSRMAAGVCQSMRRRTRKPRLNHDASRCIRSRSTEASAGSPMLSRSRRMATIWAVAPGARLSRRKNSWRGLSTRLLQRGHGRRIGVRQIGLGGGRQRVGVGLHGGAGSRGRRGARRRPAPGSGRGSRWRWPRPTPRRDRTGAQPPARAGPPWAASRRATAATAGGPARRR